MRKLIPAFLLLPCWSIYGVLVLMATERPNILFIASDDMRPQLGCYGYPEVISPHLDRLAKKGLVFHRSYVQQALCSPSRISMLSGRYPSSTGIFEIGRPLRVTMPDIVTMPQHFKNHGYDTRSLGKIYHVGIDDDASWSVPAWHSKKPRTSRATQQSIASFLAQSRSSGIEPAKQGKGSRNSVIPAFESVDCADEDLLDGDTAVHAIHQLQHYARNPDQPFFLAVGFANPHVPWIAPKKYFDLYSPEALTLAGNEFLPKDAPKFAATSGADFYSYKDVPQVSGEEMPESYKRNCLRAYLAAITYVDAQIGKLLNALEDTGLSSNTIVVFWSDHGYYMGEHTWWGAKHNNYEGATRNCLIISTPNQKTAGSSTMAIAQSVDLAPTLTELCRLPAEQGFEGKSLVPILQDAAGSVNEAAYSWYPKAGYLGVAMRTDQWRFVEWTKEGNETERELYDATADFQNDRNLAQLPEYRTWVASLSLELRKKFPVQKFVPPKVAK
jgi:iduronate 2-sulfatase